MLILQCILLFAGTLLCGVNSQVVPFYNGSFYASGELTREQFYINKEYFAKELAFFTEAFDSIGKKGAFQVSIKDDIFVFLYDMRVQKRYLLRTQGGRSTKCENLPLPPRWNRKLMSDVIRAPDGRDYMPVRHSLLLRSKLTIYTREEAMSRGVYVTVFGGRSEDNVAAVLKWTLNRDYVPKDYYDNVGDAATRITTTKKTVPQPDPPISSYPWPPERFPDLAAAMSAPLSSAPPVLWEETLWWNPPKSYLQPTLTTRVFNFDYIKNPIHNYLLQIPDGVRCEGYRNPDLRGPMYTTLRVFSFSAVTWSNKKKHHRRISGWVDANQKLYRLDYKPFSGGRTSRYTTVIFSGKEGVGYKIPSQVGVPCEQFLIANTSFDIQMIIAPNEVAKLTAKTFFTGSDQRKIVDYKKAAFQGGIPCHKWDVVREDWPPGSFGVKTLWEWCFVDMTKYSNVDKTLTAVSLDIHVLEALDSSTPGTEDLAVGDVYSYEFFDFNKTSADVVETTAFFTGACYRKSNWTRIRFTIQDEISQEVLKESAFHVIVLRTVATFAGVTVASLRVGKVKAYTKGQHTYVEVVLLDRFPNSTYTPRSIPTHESIKKLQYNIKIRKLKFQYKGKSYLVTDMCKLP